MTVSNETRQKILDVLGKWGHQPPSNVDALADEIMTVLADALPPVKLPGSEGWEGAYEWGQELEERFPGQDGYNFATACNYNAYGPCAESEITLLVMLKEGERDGEHWTWQVDLANGEVWRAEGWCDYTGWDCQSNLSWDRVGG